jgi:hypothetical protein
MTKRRMSLACSSVRSRSKSAAVKMGWRGEERRMVDGLLPWSLQCYRLVTGCRITQASAEGKKEETEGKERRTVRRSRGGSRSDGKREDGQAFVSRGW